MVRLRFETDLSTSLKAQADFAKAVDKVGDSASKGVREMNALEKAAKRLVDSNLSPQERYNRQLDTMAKAVKAGRLSMDEAERTAARLRARLDETARSSTNAFGASALSGIKSYVTGMVSITAAIAAVRSELENVRAEAERTTQAQLTGAQARDILKRNIAVLGPQAGGAFEQRAVALAGELTLPQRIVDTALAEAFSASGGNVEESFRRTRVAAQFLKTQPEGIGSFAGSLGDIAKATGDQDALRNLGFMITVGAASRVPDAAKQAKNIPAALASAKTFGATAEEGGALFAALSVAAAEFEGDVSKTATITASESLRSFFGKKVSRRRFAAEDVDTFKERLAALRADPKLAREFAGVGAFGRAQTKGPLEEFFTDPNSEIARLYQQNLGGFGTREEQIQRAQSTLGYLDTGRLAQTAATERAVSSITEQFRLTQDAELTNQARDEIITRLWQLGAGPFRAAVGAGVTFRTGATLSPAEAASELEGGLRNPFRTGSAELIENTRQMVGELRRISENTGGPTREIRPSGRQE